jgi:phospholipid N-methyltransferase
MLREGLCVEIGAGTGPVTRAILDRGVPPERLVVVEKSLPLAELLAERFPGVDVRCCGAEEMGAFVGDTPVSAVVSSLPFRSLPVYTASAIMSEVDRVLSPGGLFIQFTYALVGDMPFIPPHFKKLRTRVVIRNIPPAKVEVFIKPGRRKRENAAAV